jgi:hypothetical protein
MDKSQPRKKTEKAAALAAFFVCAMIVKKSRAG